MEIIYEEEIKLPEIRFNFAEIKCEIEAAVQKYETLIYSDEQLREAKKDRATLNKLRTALADECKRRKAEYLAPYEAFKAKVDELTAIIDKPIAAIDRQLKEADEKRRAEKREEIGAYWTQTEKPAALDWVTLPRIFDEKWLNATVPMRAIQEEIDGWIYRIETEMQTIASLPEFAFEALEVYKMTLDLNKAIGEGKRLADIQKRKAEAEAAAKAAQAAQAEAKPLPVADDVKPAAEELKPAADDTGKMWVKFAALLDMEQALALKAFFTERGITFKAI